MKRVLLFVMAVMTFGLGMAQNVWTAGYYTKSDGDHKSAVYKNGIKQFEGSDTDPNTEANAVIVVGDKVFWANNGINSDGTYGFADIMMNDAALLYSPGNEGRHINALFTN